MTFSKVKKVLKEGGVKFTSTKSWEIYITPKNRTRENIQAFLMACRNPDMCNWHIEFPEKGKAKAWW